MSQPELLVVGGGLSGLCCALAAARDRNGTRRVRLFEAERCLAGEGGRAEADRAAETPLRAEGDGEDETSKEALRWLEEVLGEELQDSDESSTPVGVEVLRRLTSLVRSHPEVEVLTEALVTRLWSGGCGFERHGEELKAEGPVVLCCGGLLGHRGPGSLLARLRPDLLHLPVATLAGAAGAVLAPAVFALGAAVASGRVALHATAEVTGASEDELAQEMLRQAAKAVLKKAKAKAAATNVSWMKLVPDLHFDKEHQFDWDRVHFRGHDAYGGGKDGTGDEDLWMKADLHFGSFQMPQKCAKSKKKRSKPSKSVYWKLKPNEGVEFQECGLSVKAMKLKKALKELDSFVKIKPQDLDQRCRYSILDLRKSLEQSMRLCGEFGATASQIKSDLDTEKHRMCTVMLQRSYNEQRSGYIWGEENPKQQVEDLQAQQRKAKDPQEHVSIRRKIKELKEDWRTDCSNSCFRRHDVFCLYLAKPNAKKAFARVTCSIKIFRECSVVDPFTGKLTCCWPCWLVLPGPCARLTRRRVRDLAQEIQVFRRPGAARVIAGRARLGLRLKWPALFCFEGGLVVEGSGRVLGQKTSAPLPRLFAAGEAAAVPGKSLLRCALRRIGWKWLQLSPRPAARARACDGLLAYGPCPMATRRRAAALLLPLAWLLGANRGAAFASLDPRQITRRIAEARSAGEVLSRVQEEKKDNPRLGFIALSAAWSRMAKMRILASDPALRNPFLPDLVALTRSALRRAASEAKNARGVANIFWAAAKLRALRPQLAPLQPALMAAARKAAPHMDAQQVANTIWGTAELLETEGDREALLLALAERAERVRPQMTAQAVANIFWATAKLSKSGGGSIVAVLPTLATRAEEVRSDMNAQHVANIIWAIAKLSSSDSSAFALLPALVERVQEVRSQLNAQGVANVIWATAKLSDVGENSLLASLPMLAARIHDVRAQLHAQGVSNIIWATAKLSDLGDSSLLAVLPTLGKRMQEVLPQMNARDFANIFWAMAPLSESGERTLLALLPSLVGPSQDVLSQLPPQGLSNVIWAAAKLSDHGEDSLVALLPALVKRAQEVSSEMSAQAAANIIWAAGKLAESGDSSLVALLPTLADRAKQLSPQMTAQGSANIIWAAAKLAEVDRSLLASLPSLVDRVQEVKTELDAQLVANILWAAAILLELGNSTLLPALPTLEKRAVELQSQMNAQDVSNIIWATAKLCDSAEAGGFLRALPILAGRAKEVRDMRARHVANILWASSRLSSRNPCGSDRILSWATGQLSELESIADLLAVSRVSPSDEAAPEAGSLLRMGRAIGSRGGQLDLRNELQSKVPVAEMCADLPELEAPQDLSGWDVGRPSPHQVPEPRPGRNMASDAAGLAQDPGVCGGAVGGDAHPPAEGQQQTGHSPPRASPKKAIRTSARGRMSQDAISDCDKMVAASAWTEVMLLDRIRSASATELDIAGQQQTGHSLTASPTTARASFEAQQAETLQKSLARALTDGNLAAAAEDERPRRAAEAELGVASLQLIAMPQDADFEMSLALGFGFRCGLPVQKALAELPEALKGLARQWAGRPAEGVVKFLERHCRLPLKLQARIPEALESSAKALLILGEFSGGADILENLDNQQVNGHAPAAPEEEPAGGRGNAYATLLYGSGARAPPRPRAIQIGAWICLVRFEVEYFLGALVLGWSLRAHGCQADRVLLYTQDVPEPFLEALEVFWYLRQVDYLQGCPQLYENYKVSRFQDVFTKLQALSCTDYSQARCPCRAEAVLRRLVFGARGSREQPEHGADFTAEDLWSWQRARGSVGGWARRGQGMNLAAFRHLVMLLRPDAKVYERMVREIRDPTHPEHLGTFGPECLGQRQDYLARFFTTFGRGAWAHLHARFNYQPNLPDDYVGAAHRKLDVIQDVMVAHYSGGRARAQSGEWQDVSQVKPWKLRNLELNAAWRKACVGSLRPRSLRDDTLEAEMGGEVAVGQRDTGLPANVKAVMWEWILALRRCDQELLEAAVDLLFLIGEAGGEDDASEPGSPEPTSLRQLTLYDPCYIKGPCYKGVLWFPGSEFRGPGWYCKDRLDLKKEDALDPCHIAAPCFFGAVWAGKEWQCGAEDPSKVKGRYEDLMRKLLKGPTRDDKIWAIKELYDELPSPATICPKRGYQAPKKCRMIGMGHGKMMLGLNSSTVLFDLVVCEDPEMRGRASGVLYNMVSESQANLPRLINKMGGLKQLVLNFNPETNASQKDRWKAQFGLNMLTSECKARAPDMCDFFPELVHMSSTGLQDLVWHPPIGTGYQLQVALQEAWVSSCTVKNGVPRKEDFEACGGAGLHKLSNGTEEQVFATLSSLNSLLRQDMWRVAFTEDLKAKVKPVLHKLPQGCKGLAQGLLA
ncbi:unnamed protein product [Effrenium voratum]|nr:unnamed protein product [Effrenium voratum]